MTIGQISGYIKQAVIAAGYETPDHFSVDIPEQVQFGDFATNVALIVSKNTKTQPVVVARTIADTLSTLLSEIGIVSVAGPGFINIALLGSTVLGALSNLSTREKITRALHSPAVSGTVMVEYTDPNPFKEFHIGHLMPNVIGEAIARLYESTGHSVLRANYQGDVGPHVAKALWGMQQLSIEYTKLIGTSDGREKARFLGRAYATGAAAYEANGDAKNAIDEINKKLYGILDGSVIDTGLRNLFDTGRQWSLDHFEELYTILGTKFDYYFFESEMAVPGIEIVKKFLSLGLFEISDGAVIYRGERVGLCTQVFLTSHNTPTYGTKDLALNTKKFEMIPGLARSIIVTGSEQNAYFQVLLSALGVINPVVAARTTHIGHGLMLGIDGKKISSRKGGGVSGEGLIHEVCELVREKMTAAEKQSHHTSISDELVFSIAVGAIKYVILKQSPGKNIVFDFEHSISFEGDSGPYLMYTYARMASVIRRATTMSVVPRLCADSPVSQLERVALRYPDVVLRGLAENSAHGVTGYLLKLTHEFNSWYGQHQVVDSTDMVLSGHRLAVVSAVYTILGHGLWVLGIHAPESM